MSLYSIFMKLEGFHEFSPQNRLRRYEVPRLILIKHETKPEILYILIYKTRHERRETNTR
jgi:hypothetical protein